MALWLCGIDLALTLCLAGSHACSCNGIINSKGQGECLTTFRGKQYCYVDQGECKDEKVGSSSGTFWSFEACENYSAYGPECYGLNGERCTPVLRNGKWRTRHMRRMVGAFIGVVEVRA